jgi:hypothetical protein
MRVPCRAKSGSSSPVSRLSIATQETSGMPCSGLGDRTWRPNRSSHQVVSCDNDIVLAVPPPSVKTHCRIGSHLSDEQGCEITKVKCAPDLIAGDVESNVEHRSAPNVRVPRAGVPNCPAPGSTPQRVTHAGKSNQAPYWRATISDARNRQVEAFYK